MHLRRRRKTTTEVWMDYVQDLAERAVEYGEQALAALGPRVEDAREAAAVVYDQAREKVRDEYVPKVREEIGERVRNDVVPKAKAAAASPLVAAALAKSPIELSKPAPPPAETHRVRNSVVALGLGGGVAYAVTRFRGGSSSTSGSSYAPPQPARPTAVPDPAPATVPGDGPTLADLSDPVRPDQPVDPNASSLSEPGFSEGHPSDSRRPGDDQA